MNKFLLKNTLKNKKRIKRSSKNTITLLDKRQKFLIGVGFLSLFFFIGSYFLNTYGVVSAFILSLLSDLFLFWGIYPDLEDNFHPQIFSLTFLYSLSFGLFAFLTPYRFISRVILTILYAIGIYSLFLCENIFIIATGRTIALLSSARIISLVVSLVISMFISSAIFSSHFIIFIEAPLVFIMYFLISSHGIWSYTLDKNFKKDLYWVIMISLLITELSLILWFWPSSPAILALFLTGIWYFLIGLSHAWLDKRLFKNVFIEYIWICLISILLIISFTKWG